jgi:hypothetical protein
MLQPLQPKRRSLARFEGAEAVLSYYPSGHFMAEHAHECDQRSMILSGGLFEETPSRTARPSASHIGFKAAGHKHENRYGPNGALILAVNAEPCSRPKTLWSWGPAAGAADAAHLVRLMLEAWRSRRPGVDRPDGRAGVHADPPALKLCAGLVVARARGGAGRPCRDERAERWRMKRGCTGCICRVAMPGFMARRSVWTIAACG